MKKRMIGISLAAAALFAAEAGQAAFMDKYQDRQGVFFGVGAGGGTGQTEIDGGGDTSAIGVVPTARVGIGSTSDLLFDLEGMYFHGTDDGIDQDQMAFTIGLTKFLTKELYLGAGFGFASGSLDAGGGVDETQSGQALRVGLGYEIFTSADMALSLGGTYRAHYFDDFDFTFVGLNVGLTWY